MVRAGTSLTLEENGGGTSFTWHAIASQSGREIQAAVEKVSPVWLLKGLSMLEGWGSGSSELASPMLGCSKWEEYFKAKCKSVRRL